MYGKGMQILLHRHSSVMVKFPWISPQQFDSLVVEPLGAFDDAPQISCMGRSIVALEVLPREPGDNRSRILIAQYLPISHGCSPGGFEQHRLQV
jgi:hypothetical protein